MMVDRREFIRNGGILAAAGVLTTSFDKLAPIHRIPQAPASGFSSVNWIIYTDGSYIYAENGATGTIDYGGPNNAGSASGTDVNSILNAIIMNIPSGQGVENSLGVVISFLPGDYQGDGTNIVYLPNS